MVEKKSDKTIMTQMIKIMGEQKRITLRGIIGAFNDRDKNGRRIPGRIFVSPGRVATIIKNNPDIFEVKEMIGVTKVYGLKNE